VREVEGMLASMRNRVASTGMGLPVRRQQ
jgi:hypothetical protein